MQPNRHPIRLAPSLICADPLNLKADLEALDRAGVERLHLDVMDGQFVPNLGLNFETIRQVAKATATPLDVHLMVQDPEAFLPRLQGLRLDSVSFHVEAERYPLRLIRMIRALGFRPGVALNPATPAEGLGYYIQELDYMLLMMFEPGFAGLAFIPEMLDKITAVRELAAHQGHPLSIMVDGGITEQAARACIERGADTLVLGYLSIFDGRDLYEACTDFRRRIETGSSRDADSTRAFV